MTTLHRNVLALSTAIIVAASFTPALAERGSSEAAESYSQQVAAQEAATAAWCRQILSDSRRSDSGEAAYCREVLQHS